MGLVWCAMVWLLFLWLPSEGMAQVGGTPIPGTAATDGIPIPALSIEESTLSRPETASPAEPTPDKPAESGPASVETPAAEATSSTPTESRPASDSTTSQSDSTASEPTSVEQGSPDSVSVEPAPSEERATDVGTQEDAAAADVAPMESPPEPASPLLFDGDYLATIDRLRRELRLDPNATDARFALGQALFGLGEVDGAVDEYRRVLRERPTSIPARLHLATALMTKRRWKEAQKELSIVLEQDKTVVAAHHNFAAVRYSLGDVRGAIEAYRAALAIAPDSVETHYQLGVVLRLARRTKDAVPELQAAAEAGHPKAQYFLGTAYSSGAGIDRDLPMAIRWWMAASEHGVPEAQDALSRLRKTALKKGSSKTANKTLQAFEAYRSDLWFAFPELTPTGTDETVGITLLQAFRLKEAVPTLIREATAMGELSERYLAALYEQGLPTYLEPYDPRILRYFEMAAGDGAPNARLALARIHALGLGVPADRGKALVILKGLPPAYAEQFLQDLVAHPAGTPPQTVTPPSEKTEPTP